MTTPVRKKLIEVSIPLEAINVASAREKSIRHGHPSTLHLWWARRPLAACRAVLFAQLVDDPSSWPDRFPTEEAQDAERRRLHKVIEAMVPWEASNNETVLNAARWEIARSVAWGLDEEPPVQGDGPAILDYLQTKAPPVYDPFSGGGSIPLEAQRLGLRAYGSDLNPVAVLIGKALVEIPPKFAGRPPVNPKSRAEAAHGQVRAWKGAQGLAEDVRYYGQWMRDEAEKRIGHLYPKARLADGSQATVIAWLWARTVRSPDPAAKGAIVPLVSSFMLSSKTKGEKVLRPVVDVHAGTWSFEIVNNPSQTEIAAARKGTRGDRGFVCVLTGTPIGFDYVRSEAKAGRVGMKMTAAAVQSRRGRAYLPATEEMESAASEAEYAWEPSGTLDPNALGFRIPEYGLLQWSDLYTARQKALLSSLADLSVEAANRAANDARAAGAEENAYRIGIGTYLSMSVSKLSDFASVLTPWKADAECPVHVFSKHALSMVWDFAEPNALADSSGSYLSILKNLTASLSDRCVPAIPGKYSVSIVDAAKADYRESFLFSTDPPYYDNIGYADLSDYFYVWLKFSAGRLYPELFRRLLTNKDDELVATPHRHGGKVGAGEFFLTGMSEALRRAGESSTDPIAIFYSFKQAENTKEGTSSTGWERFLQAISDAGLGVDGTWPIRTEGVSRLRTLGSNALASSIVLVCRKRAVDASIITRADFIRTLKREMPAAIDAIRKAGVGPVDMQQSVIGPGMGVFSRHAKVLEDDDGAMSVKTALAVINRVWEEIENELDQAFDPETQVALAWYATYGFDARASGELITLTTAKNTSDRALFASGVFKDMKGKAGLTPRGELPPGWSPASDKTLTTWECVQHTARVLNAADGGGEAAAALVAQMGPRAEEARALAYRLFEIATNKGWAAEALVYNELAQEWTKLEDGAATLDDAGRSPGPNQTTFAFDGSA